MIRRIKESDIKSIISLELETLNTVKEHIERMPSIQPEAYYECPHCYDIRKRPKAFGWFECPVCGARVTRNLRRLWKK